MCQLRWSSWWCPTHLRRCPCRNRPGAYGLGHCSVVGGRVIADEAELAERVEPASHRPPAPPVVEDAGVTGILSRGLG
jgi:hypothetical protein